MPYIEVRRARQHRPCDSHHLRHVESMTGICRSRLPHILTLLKLTQGPIKRSLRKQAPTELTGGFVEERWRHRVQSRSIGANRDALGTTCSTPYINSIFSGQSSLIQHHQRASRGPIACYCHHPTTGGHSDPLLCLRSTRCIGAAPGACSLTQAVP